MIDPDEIRRRVEKAVRLAGRDAWLVGYDINGIQELVTASNRPIAMWGACHAIKDFDRAQAETALSIFAGGGRGVALAPSEDAAQERISTLASEFCRATDGGVLVGAAVPYGRDVAASITWLRRKLEIAKDEAPRPGETLPADKQTQCPDCSARRADRPVDGKEGVRLVCGRCALLIHLARKTGKEASTSLVDFARHRRLAAISADGNNLGAFFARPTSLEELAAASAAVATIFGEAHEAALRAAQRYPALSPVTGGDDIRVFMAPEGVLTYVETLVREVERRAQAAGDLGGMLSPDRARELAQLGVGVGVVVAGDHYPASQLMAHAHAHERAAKTICRTPQTRAGAASAAGPRSAFDFAVLAASEQAAVAAGPPPISMDEASWARTLHAAKTLRHVPGAQRAVLAERRTLPLEEFENLLRYQVARQRHWQQWFEACGVDWTNPAALSAHVSHVRADLLDLLPPEEATA